MYLWEGAGLVDVLCVCVCVCRGVGVGLSRRGRVCAGGWCAC